MNMYVWNVAWTNRLNWKHAVTVVAPGIAEAISLAEAKARPPSGWEKDYNPRISEVTCNGLVDALWPRQMTVEELALLEVERVLA